MRRILKRMTIHSTSQIGNVLRNVVIFNFRNSREVLMRAESIPTQVEQFFKLLESRKIKNVLVNGISFLTYVEGRNTQDIDLIMALPSLANFPEIKIKNQIGILRVGIMVSYKSICC